MGKGSLALALVVVRRICGVRQTCSAGAVSRCCCFSRMYERLRDAFESNSRSSALSRRASDLKDARPSLLVFAETRFLRPRANGARRDTAAGRPRKMAGQEECAPGCDRRRRLHAQTPRANRSRAWVTAVLLVRFACAACTAACSQSKVWTGAIITAASQVRG